MNEPSSLRTFLDLLRRTDGEGVAVVKRPVSPELELGTVVKKLERIDDRVLFFEKVDGHQVPLVINVFGTKARTALALGLDRNSSPSHTLAEFASRLERRGEARICEAGAVQEKIVTGDAVDLGLLPATIHAANQGGRYINAGVFLVRDPATGAINGGIYRIMLKSKSTFTVSVDPGHDLGRVIAAGRDRGVPVPFAVVIGADPVVYLASQAKVGISRDFYDVVGALRSETADVVRCASNDLLVPASAEIVVEGHIVSGETAAEGPYGEFSYYYGSDPQATLCHVDAITHRADAIYLDINPVHSEHRNLWLHPGRELGLLSKLQSQVPDVTGAHIPLDGAGMVCIVSIRKRHNGDSRRALMIAMASDMFIKHAVIVDDDVDIHDFTKVLWALTTRFQADRDTIIVSGVRGYAEDPSGYFYGPEASGRLTTKIGYDATLPVGQDAPQPADALPARYADLDASDYIEDL